MEPWLNPDEVRQTLRLEKPFDVKSELALSVEQVVTLRLPGLIGDERISQLRTYFAEDSEEKDPELEPYKEPLKLFLLYAAWADYHLGGNVSYTNTGPVQKAHEDSEAISNQQRTELRVKYERLADFFATQLVKLRDTQPCKPLPVASQQFSKAVGAKSTAHHCRRCW